MKVEVLYFDGCPNHEALLSHVRELLVAARVDDDMELVRIEDADEAERERFLARRSCAPTARTASERTDFGRKCRLCATADRLRGLPADEWVLAAVGRAQRRSG